MICLFPGAAWWSMASHLAAQDYLARLQATGLNLSPLNDPYAALSALSGSGLKQNKPPKQPNRNERLVKLLFIMTKILCNTLIRFQILLHGVRKSRIDILYDG